MNKELKISKFLSLILRHNPPKYNLNIEKNGWANVNEIIKIINKKFNKIDLNDLKKIVKNDNKQRYKLLNNKIRANQGHSINVDLDLTPLSLKELPNWLYHGTTEKAKEVILKEGLKPMSRQYVHLSENIETALNVANRRKTKNIYIFKISTIELINNNVDIFKSENNVYLIKKIDKKFLR